MEGQDPLQSKDQEFGVSEEFSQMLKEI